MATQSLVSKLIKQITVENPSTQRSIVKSCHVSQSNISRTIKQFNFALQKKQRVHQLTSSNIEKRHRCATGLYQQLANHRYETFITTNKFWFYPDGTEGK